MKYSEIKELYEYLDFDKDKVKKAIKSINEGVVTIENILKDYYLEDSDYYYCQDDYVVLHNGSICSIDEALWCEGNEEYYLEEDMVRVYSRRNDILYYSKYYVEHNDYFIYYDGDYYDDEGAEYNDIVWCHDIEEYRTADECYFNEDEACYQSQPVDIYTRPYHNGSHKILIFNNKSKYKIGFEIEKEDEEVLKSVEIDEFESETDYLWRKESDSSLDSESGFELISPTFEFDIDKIFEHIEANDVLVNHINADKGYSCGGHINLSENGLTGMELFDKIKGYTPLFYALYYGRVDKNYSKGKSNDDLKNDNEKYQAIKIHSNRIEFRIISAVPNVKTLKWRCKLIRMILQHPTSDIIQAYYNVDTKFTKLLSQTYDKEGLSKLKDRFIKYTKQFENLNIKK